MPDTERKRPGPKPQPINHGTVGGYQTHLRRTGPGSACDKCRKAWNTYWREATK